MAGDLVLNLGAFVQAEDNDGDKVIAQADDLVATIDDDMPKLEVGNIAGSGTVDPQIGYWARAVGADVTGFLNVVISGYSINNVAGAGTTSLTGPVTLANGDQVFTGTITDDFDGDPLNGLEDLDFTLTFRDDVTYVFNLDGGFGSSFTFSSADGSLESGGPDAVQTLTLPGESIIFAAVDPNASTTDIKNALLNLNLTEAQIETLIGNGGIDFIDLEGVEMNVSNSGIGNDNNNFNGDDVAQVADGGESFIVNPQTPLTSMKVFIDNSVGGFDPGTTIAPGAEELFYTVYLESGAVVGPVRVFDDPGVLDNEAGGQVSFTITASSADQIDFVQLTMAKGTIKIPVIEFTQDIENIADPVSIDFQASLTDNDDDTVISDFTVDLESDLMPAVPPDITLVGINTETDAFNVDLALGHDAWVVQNFEMGADKIVLLNPLFDYTLITDSGGPDVITVGTTTITVQNGTDLLTAADIVVAYSDRIMDGNILAGDGGVDILDGGPNGDALIGKGSGDDLTGNGGADAFVFAELTDGGDTISDFNSSEGDFLVISASGFNSDLMEGTLEAANFAANSGGLGGVDDFFLYDTDTGVLSFDADGIDPGLATVIATLDGVTVPTLTADDILIIA
jgi:Ca2+-binding RTX toxin-like protein